MGLSNIGKAVQGAAKGDSLGQVFGDLTKGTAIGAGVDVANGKPVQDAVQGITQPSAFVPVAPVSAPDMSGGTIPDYSQFIAQNAAPKGSGGLAAILKLLGA